VAQLPERFHLVAWSMGGYIAFAMLPRIRERLISLMLVDTTARPEEPYTTARRLELIAKAEREGVAAASIKSIAYSCRDIGVVDPAARDGVLQSWVELGLDAYRRQQRAIIDRPDARPQLGLITCPTMIIVGDSDQVTPPDCAEELRDHIPGSALRVLPQCGHCPPLEFPDTMNQILDDWLAGDTDQRPRLGDGTA
jgi:pimeloyl-ACP methyl ester carboxylesterase